MGDEANADQDLEAKTPKSPAVFKFISSDTTSSNLKWNDVDLSVQTKKGRKEILKRVTGYLNSGELTCILGPSGSGKTTLLNVLSGRMGAGGRFNTQIGGTITADGTSIHPTKAQHLFGYVMQEDSLYATESPREVFEFSARLRLRDIDESNLSMVLEDMISSLGLSECANTMVGNEMVKGISGGQKKRTSIGAELITNPRITFLDEPTSGLDTAAAFQVVSVLKELTKAQMSVMCTIHQPSSEIFQLFDSAIFLARGQVVYQGPPSGIRAHFSTLGFTCPDEYNPADFVMFLVGSAGEEQFAKLVTGMQSSFLMGEAKEATNAGTVPDPPPSKGFFVQFKALVSRQLRNAIRDKASLGGRFGLTLFMNAIFSVIFFQVGKLDKSDYDIQSHMGAVTMVGINAMFGCTQPALLAFPSERPVFLREYASQMYGVIPYLLSKTAVELVMLILQVFEMWLINYWMMGFHGNFFLMVGGSALIGAASASLGLLLGCTVPDVKTAIEIVPAVFVPQILFAGFFIKMDQIPVVLRWLQYVCSLKWGMNVLLIAEFDKSGNSGGAKLLDQNNIEPTHLTLYILILFGVIVVCRLAAGMLLLKKAKTLYG